METKLYIGNMSYNTSEDDLRGLFTQAGTVISVSLIKDNATGISKGFAFVEMDSQASAQKAISLFDKHMFNEQQLAVNFARPREERGRGDFQKRRHRKRGGGKRRY